MEAQRVRLNPVIAVPAKDEEQRFPVLLDALARQNWHRSAETPLKIVAVLNNCADRTKDAARRAVHDRTGLSLELIEVDFPPERAHVGSARRLAMDRALALCGTAHVGVILTTDADAVPEPDWLAANLRAIERGADLVGGMLYGNREEEARFGPGFAARAAAVAAYGVHCDRLASLLDPQPHDPWPRHQDHTGGSLAIRADMYRAVGGLPVLAFREDLALVSRVRAAGGRLTHPMDVRVEVSARLAGRAPGGMADCLKDWIRAEAEGSPLLVQDPTRLKTRLLRRRAIRDVCAGSGAAREQGLSRLGIDPADMPDGDAARASVEALIERFVPDEPDAPSDTNIAVAMPLILEMIADLEESTRAA